MHIYTIKNTKNYSSIYFSEFKYILDYTKKNKIKKRFDFPLKNQSVFLNMLHYKKKDTNY